jgi:hypothetical protein
MLHELRREAIVNELQHLAQRLCALPVRDPANESVAAIEQPKPVLNGPATQTPSATADAEEAIVTVEPPLTGRAGDWRQAAQRIDAELAQYFGGASPRH